MSNAGKSVSGERLALRGKKVTSPYGLFIGGCGRTLLFIVLLPLTAYRSPLTAVQIQDNSFLIEEAYNQEWGVVQHIATFARVRGVSGWGATFTQEWPAPSERHQLSFTVPLVRVPGADGMQTGVGDIALNYRFQLPTDIDRIAVAPRLSVLLPTGDEADGTGSGGSGIQFNLPVSLAIGSTLVTHLNAGATYTPAARAASGAEAATNGVAVGGSLIWLVHPKLNLMVETLWARDELVVGDDATARATSHVVAPGLRGAIDFVSGLQVVPGIAVPIGVGSSDGERGVFIYVSFEHPFRRR